MYVQNQKGAIFVQSRTGADSWKVSTDLASKKLANIAFVVCSSLTRKDAAVRANEE